LQQNGGLLIRGSQVRILPGALKRLQMSTSVDRSEDRT
jgi:hypothetical protein